jgi:hypothetical protein
MRAPPNAYRATEQLVIEPTDFWRYMPFYRVQGFCVYDFTVIVLITAGLWRLSQRGEPQRA